MTWLKSKKSLRSTKKGFALIEALVGSVVFAVVALSAYQAFAGLMTAVLASRAKVAATSIANERIEIIRNLPYQDVGVSGGLPSGKILREETIARDGYSFGVQTTIRNVDDPFDGTIGGNPADISPSDYKSVHLDITCSNCKNFTPLQFTTLVAPYALETSSNNGALFIQVFDALGVPIQGALVHIVNNQTSPTITIDDVTDNGGWIRIVDAPPGTNAYNITATKPGYSTDQTYPPGGTAGVSPLNPDSNVVIHQITQTSFSIDRTSTLNVSSVDAMCTPSPSIGFSLTGAKIIGVPNILKYPAKNFTTDATGSSTISNLEWDTYSALLTSSSYDLAGVSLLPTFSLSPNETKNLQIMAVPHTGNSLLVSVQDASGVPINDATVHLQGGSFDETKTTNTGTCPMPGQVFWNGLAGGTYTLTVSKSGYQDNVSSISASSWQNKNVTLTP